MKRSNRLMRVLGAFAVFGLLTALLPISQVASFRADACPPGASPWKYIDPVAIIGGVAYFVDASGAIIGPVLHAGAAAGAGAGGHLSGVKKIPGYGQGNADNSVSYDQWAKLHNFSGQTP